MRPIGLSLLAALCLLGTINSQAAEEEAELFREDFSRYPLGPLSVPIGQLNGAIQEYHYLPHRGVATAPWANPICHLDSWVAGEENGQSYLEQHLAPSNTAMIPRLFAPLFITGEPEWQDCTVEVSVCPLSTAEFAGVVFRYHTNRHHYLFSLEGGKKARLALRLPLEEQYRICSWRELGSKDFTYQPNKYYRLKVENRGPTIRAYVDDQLVLMASDEEITHGKVGISATSPARFRDFKVSVAPETKQQITEKIRQRQDELARLQADNPRPKLWKKFETPNFGAGRNVRFGDLDGDGATDMLIAQNVPKVAGDSAVEISCLTAVTLDGKKLWQMGRPDQRNGLLTCDTPFQICDIDGSGRNDVVLCKDFKLQVLDGRTGKLKRATDLPKITGYPDVPEAGPKVWPYERTNGDSIVFVNFSGEKNHKDIVVKDRYWNFWVFDRDLKQLWSGQGMLGHYPFAVPDEKSGQEKLAIGYSLWDASGKQLWTNDQRMHQHADSIFIGNITGDPNEQPLAFYCGSDDGFMLADSRGVIRRHQRVGHTQTAAIGKFRPDMQGLQYATVNFWRNPGIISLFDARGELLQQEEPIHSGCPMLPVNWRGDGQEFILLSGNIREGGMLDGQLRRVAMFPDDGHPDLCAAVHDLTGDGRDEIVLWDQKQVWIYTQDKPFAGDKIYTPKRNPNYNDSNYRIHVSWPEWKATAAQASR